MSRTPISAPFVSALDESATIAALAALAQPYRLRAFRALVVAGRLGMTPGTLADGLGIAPSALSFHLKELVHAGLVTRHRQGRFVVCRAAFDRFEGVLSYLTENCCGSEARTGDAGPGRRMPA